jgi:hypothetical protein
MFIEVLRRTFLGRLVRTENRARMSGLFLWLRQSCTIRRARLQAWDATCRGTM